MVSQLAPHTVSNADKRINADRQPRRRKDGAKAIIAAIVILAAVGLIRAGGSKPAGEPMITVVAANRDIAPGYRITFQDLHYTKLPQTYYQKGMVKNYAEVVGTISKRFVAKAEPILQADTFAKNSAFSTGIALNSRALTLRVSDEAMVDHLIAPGDRVDLIATTSASDGKKYTKTIVQNALVLLANAKEIAQSDKLRSDAGKITLQMNAKEAEVVANAIEQGKLLVTLRNPMYRANDSLSGADIRDLLPHDALREEAPLVKLEAQIPVPQAPPPPLASMAQPLASLSNAIATPVKWVVDVFKGSSKESLELDVH